MEENQEKSQQELKENNKSLAWLREQFITELQKIEPHIESFNKTLYWFSAIIVGTFVWFISSFDKFIINGAMPLKWLFITSSILLLIAVILIGACFLVSMRLSQSLKKFDFDLMKRGEKLNWGDFKESLTKLSESVAPLVKLKPPIIYACIFYGIGVFFITIYIFAFIIWYL